jgi:uncharacterized protein (TIGR02996 family)
MSDEGALLQGRIENPDADAPHLVYADWLEEHGQEVRASLGRRVSAGLLGNQPR